MTPDVCEHGGLRRKCDICDLRAEVAVLREALQVVVSETMPRRFGTPAYDLT